MKSEVMISNANDLNSFELTQNEQSSILKMSQEIQTSQITGSSSKLQLDSMHAKYNNDMPFIGTSESFQGNRRDPYSPEPLVVLRNLH